LCAIHQFARIGCHSMIGGGTMVGHDVPPYTIAATEDKRDATLRGLNLIGLKRRGFSDAAISELKKAYRLLTSDILLKEAVEKMKVELQPLPEVIYFIDFIEKAQRGICR
jgi:UDP-N-acetylglucosamine acyltransferase